jgi:hypothetical protein
MIREGHRVESRTIKPIGWSRPPWLLGLVLAVVGLGGCAASLAPTDPAPTWPVSPERLPNPAPGTAEASFTCGGRSFPVAGLEAPAGAERESGPEFDALRATIATFADAFPGSSDWTWRLADRDDTGAIFLARTDALGPPGWVSIEVAVDASGWQPSSMGQCYPRVVLSAEFGPATWALDPAFPTPAPDTSELHILVWERACSGGSPATGRMSAPVVEYTSAAVTITIGVRPLRVGEGMALTCPMPPGTPAILQLSEPLGGRTLLDGGVVPPAPPSPANG